MQNNEKSIENCGVNWLSLFLRLQQLPLNEREIPHQNTNLHIITEIYTRLAKDFPEMLYRIDISYEFSLAWGNIVKNEDPNIIRASYRDYFQLLRVRVLQDKDSLEDFNKALEHSHLGHTIRRDGYFEAGIILPVLVDILVIMKQKNRPLNDNRYLAIINFLVFAATNMYAQDNHFNNRKLPATIQDSDKYLYHQMTIDGFALFRHEDIKYFIDNFFSFSDIEIKKINDVAAKFIIRLSNQELFTVEYQKVLDYVNEQTPDFLKDDLKDDIVNKTIQTQSNIPPVIQSPNYEQARKEFYTLQSTQIIEDYYDRFLKKQAIEEYFSLELQELELDLNEKFRTKWGQFLIEKIREQIPELNHNIMKFFVENEIIEHEHLLASAITIDTKRLSIFLHDIAKVYVVLIEEKLEEFDDFYFTDNRNLYMYFESLCDLTLYLLSININPDFIRKEIQHFNNNERISTYMDNFFLKKKEVHPYQKLQVLLDVVGSAKPDINLVSKLILQLQQKKEHASLLQNLRSLGATLIQNHLIEHIIQTKNKMEYPAPFLLWIYFDGLPSPKKETAINEYKNFKERFDASNNHAQENYQIEFEEFMNVNQLKIFDFIEIMGVEAFQFFKKMLGASVLELQRFMDVYQISEYREFISAVFKKFKNPLLKSHSDFVNIIIDISAFHVISEKMDFMQSKLLTEKIKNLINACTDINSLKKALPTLFAPALSTILKISFDKIDPNKIPLKDISKLILAGEKMRADQYQEVFYEMLRADFDPNRSFREFSENPSQECSIGKSLSLHNAAISEALNQYGINIKLANNYPKSVSFSMSKDEKIDFATLYKSVWNYIGILEAVLLKLQISDQYSLKLIGELKQNITKIKKEVMKKSHANLNKNEIDINDLKKLTTGSSQQLSIKIFRRIKDFKDKDVYGKYVGLLRSVYEFADHWQNTYDQIVGAMNSTKVPRFFSEHNNYHIEVWDKNRLNTLFLGDFVSCCLASNGSQFPAIVQRRMDNGMFFITVIDDKTNEPVALSWLFYGKHANDIYVVSNFFEMRAGLSLNESVRKALLGRLLLYIGEFAENIQAKKFLIRPLIYGSMKDDITCFDKIILEIEKLGGFFSPNYEDPMKRKERYYLQSLDINQFQEFNRKKLLQNFNVGTISYVETSIDNQKAFTENNI